MTEEMLEAEPVTAGPHERAAALGIDLSDNHEEAIGMLLTELEAARAEAASYLDDLRRVAADFDNFRKRALREQQLTVERASERVVMGLLPVLDSFDAAVALPEDSTTVEKLLGGMRRTREQLMAALEKEGLDVIPTFEESFDPEIHEAVSSTGDGQNLVVTDELRRGYRLRGKVVRAALVATEGRD